MIKFSPSGNYDDLLAQAKTLESMVNALKKHNTLLHEKLQEDNTAALRRKSDEIHALYETNARLSNCLHKLEKQLQGGYHT